jgi:hypothetical protein
MELSKLSENCSYHPNQVSKLTCERCNRPIYEADKRIYRQINFNADDSSYYTYHDYCLLCKASQLKSDNLRSAIILGVIGIIFVIIAIRFEFPINMLIFGFMAIGGLAFYFYRIQPAMRSESEAINFKNSIIEENPELNATRIFGFSKNFHPEIIDRFSNKEYHALSCYQCGNIIAPSDKFCPHCGDSTKEELSSGSS